MYLYFLYIYICIILYNYFEKGFEFIKNIKILRFEGDRDELETKICFNGQLWTKYLEKDKELQHIWIGTKKK